MRMIRNVSGSQNSAITWRQTPQGAQKFSGSFPFGPPTMAIARNSVFPSLTALKIAVRSAQFVAGYAAFSILQPVNTLSSTQRSAAPTAKPEYGQYACFLAFNASMTSSLFSMNFLPSGPKIRIFYVLLPYHKHGAMSKQLPAPPDIPRPGNSCPRNTF